MKEIRMNTVDSTHIHSIGYDSDDQIMIIELINGDSYRYNKVPECVYHELMNDVSLESYFNVV
jgi:hypothetical protein